MNLSGQSVQGLLHFYRLPMENLIIAHDDLDLPLGTIRIRASGGPGGQRGMASTIEQLGTKDFPRLRLGIGRPPGRMDPKDYVLQEFSKDDMKLLPDVLDRATDAVFEFVMRGLNSAMSKFNGIIKHRRHICNGRCIPSTNIRIKVSTIKETIGERCSR